MTPKQMTAWRKCMGLSQRGAAIALGCSRGAWDDYENGRQTPPLYIGLAMTAISAGFTKFTPFPRAEIILREAKQSRSKS